MGVLPPSGVLYNIDHLDFNNTSDGASARTGVLQIYQEFERSCWILSSTMELFEECGFVLHYRTYAKLERIDRATVGIGGHGSAVEGRATPAGLKIAINP